MYNELVYATPGVTRTSRSTSRTARFGVAADNVAATYSPRADVTIVRDKAFGMPHVYGATRSGAMFGLGYVGAEDRLFFMDVLRHAGRGGALELRGRRQHGRWTSEQWAVAPYTEADLEKQVADLPKYLGAQGQQIVTDANNYLAGVNQYILEATLDPTKLPGEYAAIGAQAGAVRAGRHHRHGVDGRRDLRQGRRQGARVLPARGRAGGALRRRRRAPRRSRTSGRRRTRRRPSTVLGDKRFPYQAPPAGRRVGVARPDPGTLKLEPRRDRRLDLPRLPVARPRTRCSSPAPTRPAGTR